MISLNIPAESRFSVLSCGRYKSLDGHPHPRRLLNHYFLLLGEEGCCGISQNGRNYLLVPGSFLILHSGMRHEGTGEVPVGQSHSWCHFTITPPAAASSAQGGWTLPDCGETGANYRIKLLFRQLIDAFARISPHHQCISDALLTAMLGEIADLFAQQHPKEGGAAARLAGEIRQWIVLHARTGIRSSDIAAYFGYHPDYLEAVFRSVYGQKLSEAINAERLRIARELLLTTDQSIRAVAAQSGFRDDKYFIRLFTRCEELSPARYRRAYCNDHMNH